MTRVLTTARAVQDGRKAARQLFREDATVGSLTVPYPDDATGRVDGWLVFVRDGGRVTYLGHFATFSDTTAVLADWEASA